MMCTVTTQDGTDNIVLDLRKKGCSTVRISMLISRFSAILVLFGSLILFASDQRDRSEGPTLASSSSPWNVLAVWLQGRDARCTDLSLTRLLLQLAIAA